MPSRTSRTPPPQPRADDSGCLFVILLLLWHFGFVSFHSRDAARANDRLSDIRAELAKAEGQLAKIAKISQAMKSRTDSLGARRADLEKQVDQLETAQRAIASNLQAASDLVLVPPRTALQRLYHFFADGVPGNLTAAAIIGLIGLAWRKLSRSQQARMHTSS